MYLTPHLSEDTLLIFIKLIPKMIKFYEFHVADMRDGSFTKTLRTFSEEMHRVPPLSFCLNATKVLFIINTGNYWQWINSALAFL
jgi:hypothetical protein